MTSASAECTRGLPVSDLCLSNNKTILKGPVSQHREKAETKKISIKKRVYMLLCPNVKCKDIGVIISFFFSSNRPTRLIRSSSRNVRVFLCCLSPFHLLDFEAYFSPTSQSQMSKIFRDSESLGKSAGRKWSQN